MPTIVLDLDNTLIHTKELRDDTNYKYLPAPNHRLCISGDVFHLWTRPFAGIFLALAARYTHLYLFTTSTRDYTDSVLAATGWGHHFVSTRTHDDIDTGDGGKDLARIGCPNGILVDDKKYNHTPGQVFYHIPQYKWYNRRDVEMIRLGWWLLRRVI